jgi:hypothetical protein
VVGPSNQQPAHEGADDGQQPRQDEGQLESVHVRRFELAEDVADAGGHAHLLQALLLCAQHELASLLDLALRHLDAALGQQRVEPSEVKVQQDSREESDTDGSSQLLARVVDP